MIRKRFVWKVRDREIPLGERTLIVGILNITPDSFSDGGKYDDPEAAVAHALALQEAGADILDIGAESTKPGSERIAAGEELRRLIPVLKRLEGKLDIPISVDTYKPDVAEAALDYGVAIINDPSGLTWEPDLAKVVLRFNAGLILNHTRGTPDAWAKQAPLHDVMGTVRSELDAAINRARRAGISKECIVVDPGLGFGKRQEQNGVILARLAELESLTAPVMVGPSRKSFLAKATGELTDYATAAAVVLSITGGAHLVRVHNVAAMRAAVEVADAVLTVVPQTPETGVVRPGRTEPSLEGRAPDLDDDARRRPLVSPLLKKAPRPVEHPSPILRPEVEADAEEVADEEVESDEVTEKPKEELKPAAAAKPYWENRPMREPKGGKKYDGDRPARPPREDRPSFDGPPRGGDRSYGPPRGDRPSGPPRGGDRPSYGPPRGDRPSGPPRGGDRPSYGPPRGDRPSGPPRVETGLMGHLVEIVLRVLRTGRSARRMGLLVEIVLLVRRAGIGLMGGDRPSYGPPRGDRPSGPPRGDRPYGPPRGDRPSGPPRGDRPYGPPRGDRPSGPPRGDRPYGPPRGDRPAGPPRGDRPYGPPRGDRPSGPPRGGDRPYGPPRGDRPAGPPNKRSGPPRPGGGRPPRRP